MTCLTVDLKDRPIVATALSDRRLVTVCVSDCHSAMSSPTPTFNLSDKHRNEDMSILLTIDAENPVATTDISGTQIEFQVWDYSGVPALCFTKTNGNGITVLEASPTQLKTEVTIEPADYVGMTTQLPDRDVKLEIRVWLTVEGRTSFYARGYFISRTALPKA